METLKDKRINTMKEDLIFYEEEDVKDFIERLKQELKERFWNSKEHYLLDRRAYWISHTIDNLSGFEEKEENGKTRTTRQTKG